MQHEVDQFGQKVQRLLNASGQLFSQCRSVAEVATVMRLTAQQVRDCYDYGRGTRPATGADTETSDPRKPAKRETSALRRMADSVGETSRRRHPKPGAAGGGRSAGQSNRG
jgi:hypothetical protein